MKVQIFVRTFHSIWMKKSYYRGSINYQKGFENSDNQEPPNMEIFMPILIKERLGHEKIQTTLGTYGHLYPNTNVEVAKPVLPITPAISIQQSITEQRKEPQNP